MQPQSLTFVYIFHGDAYRMKNEREHEWNLYGLWTHSSSPVVQYVCKDLDDQAKDFCLELLGRCKPKGQRLRTDHDRWLHIVNDGETLQAVIQNPRHVQIPCSIKELQGESPFSFVVKGSRRHHNNQPRPTNTHVSSDRQPRESQGEEASSQLSGNRSSQWYTTPVGREILKGIHDCISSLVRSSSEIIISRESGNHNLQLKIKHNSKSFTIYFPKDFPQSSATIFHSDTISNEREVPYGVRSKNDIIRAIRYSCGCSGCRSAIWGFERKGLRR